MISFSFFFCEFWKTSNFEKLKKISTCKNLSQWSISLNAIYDALFKALYSRDSFTGSFSTASKGKKHMVEIANWFLSFWHIFSRTENITTGETLITKFFLRGEYTVIFFIITKKLKLCSRFSRKLLTLAFCENI